MDEVLPVKKLGKLRLLACLQGDPESPLCEVHSPVVLPWSALEDIQRTCVTVCSAARASSDVTPFEESTQEKCCICTFKIVDYMTPCLHSFCEDCLQQWVIRGNSCPLCRRDTDLEELQDPYGGWHRVEDHLSREVILETLETLIQEQNLRENVDVQ